MSHTFTRFWLLFTVASGVALIFISESAHAAPPEPLAATQFFKMILGLLFVVVIIIGLAWVTRRYSNLGFSSNTNIRLESVMPLGNREKLIIVRADQNRLLIGVTQNKISTLMLLDPCDDKDCQLENENSIHKKSNFRNVLKQFSKSRS